MGIDRRTLMMAGTGLGLTAYGVGTLARAGPRSRSKKIAFGNIADLRPGSDKDQTQVLQRAIDMSAPTGTPVILPPGRFVVGAIQLRTGTRLIGAEGASILAYAGGTEFITAKGAKDIVLKDFVVDGWKSARDLIALESCSDVLINNIHALNARGNGISLQSVSGSLTDCTIKNAGAAGIFSQDANNLEISHNRVTDCANNGILVWRSKPGNDGTILTANRIARIKAKNGGSGQNGNGINVFRAHGVTLTSNRITDCAYSAIRANAASNVTMVANNCASIGEVALYAEFGFEGALIANNIVDTAATGIAVTNYNEGGRLAVVQGNLVRNLFRREHEPVDKRGNGIGVEADTAVIGNVIENALTAGLTIGWGLHMRDVMANANIIRNSTTGIVISSDPKAGACMITNNLISGSKNGAIRAMELGKPHGPDLVDQDNKSERVAVWGNKSV